MRLIVLPCVRLVNAFIVTVLHGAGCSYLNLCFYTLTQKGTGLRETA